MMYKSPITLIEESIVKDIVKKQEGYVVECVRKVGVDVDKKELVKALAYDRGQYEKGYADGRADAVKYGHWTSCQGLAEVGECQCSACKTIYYGDDLYDVGETDENGIGQALMPNYCPHCGAKMDEVTE